MPLQRVFKIFFVCFLAAFALGCGSGSDDNFSNFQSFQNFDAPVRLRFQNVPARAAGTPFAAINVAVLDHNGKVVTTDDREVRLRLTEPNGANIGGDTSVNAVNGVATFTGISVDRVGTYTFTAEADGLISAESAPFTITSGGAGSVTFLQGPPPTPAPGSTPDDFDDTNSVTVGQPFANPIRVEVRDASGNLVTDNVTVQLRVVRDATGGVTVSNNTAVAVNGVATFPNFTIDSGGGIMVLAAIVSADALVISDPFMVAAPFSLYAASASDVVNPPDRPFLFRLDGVPAPVDPSVPLFMAPIVNNTATEEVFGMATLPNGNVIVVLGDPPGVAPYLASLDLTTGVATPIGTNLGLAGTLLPTDLTVDPSTGTVYMYAASVISGTGQLYTVDPTNGTATLLPGAASNNFRFMTLAYDVFDANGPVLYGIGRDTTDTNNTFVTFDLTTGAATAVAGASANVSGDNATTGYARATTLTVNPFNPNQLVGVFQAPVAANAMTGFEARFMTKTSGATEATLNNFLPSFGATFTFP